MITFNFTDFSEIKPFDKVVLPLPGMEDFFSYVFSGKTAIAFVLRYLRSVGVLPNKMAQVMVPQWLGIHVYTTIQQYSMITPVYTPDVKCLFIYHQWGFPQNMDKIRGFCSDKAIPFVEDCAHALDSHWAGQKVGTFGVAGIFSFAKFFACVVGGAVYSQNGYLHEFVAEQPHNGQLAKRIFGDRILFDLGRLESWEMDMHYVTYDQMNYIPAESLRLIDAQLRQGALGFRKRSYEDYKNLLPELVYWDHDAVPWAVPLIASRSRVFEKKMPEIVEKLKKENIETGIYHFDKARNMLEPFWIKCILLPCHHGMAYQEICKIAEIVDETIRK